MSKTFKHAARADAQSIDPLHLCIVGGKALPEDERGPLDTAWDPTHPLHAHDLLKPLDALDVESVFQRGVIVPIEVVRVGDVPTVSLGRGRVRKARVANVRRRAEKLPLIQVKFTIVRVTDGVELLSRMIDENLRRKKIGVLDQIDLAKQLMARGASEAQAAKTLGVSLQRFKSWLTLEDNATEKVREALRADRLSPSAAIELASISDAAKQDEALGALLASPQPTARAAKRITRETEGKELIVVPRRGDQKKMLEAVDSVSKGDAWMQGAKAALKWVLGEGAHKDLARLVKAEADD